MAGVPKPRRVLLGRILGPHGVRGEVVIRTFTAAPESIAAYGSLCDETGARAVTIESVRATAKGTIARLAGVSDRNAAEALKGLDLYVPRDRLPPAGEEEFYLADLIGLAVVDPAGSGIGEIVAAHNFGAGDLIEIKLIGSARTEFVPFNDACVPEIDIAGGRVVVVIPPATEADET